jgi:cysteinyl-tRNA synthetase
VSLKVFNTFTRTKEPFETLEPGKVRMYVCGVTVYDRCHIGHARAYVAFDVILRYLRWRGYDVTYVRNFTDVDDKIIRRSNEAGVPVTELTDTFIAAFHEDMAALGVGRADVEPRVTEHMPEIISMVQTIIDRGHGYEASGDVYFDISSFPGYLKLSGRKLDDMQAGASERVDPQEPQKRHPMDFALWKAAKPGEPAWDSPWGPGRPGWHIECSAMSSKYLGEVFDMHGGGMDLIFPHHENERAQSWAATGKEFVRTWVHNGFVNVDSEKMSKSLGNFFAIRDVIARFHPESLRYFLLTTHYRSPINFTDSAVGEAENRVEYLYETIQTACDYLARTPAQADEPEVEAARERFVLTMDDDFNTAAALALVADTSRRLNDVLMMKGKAPDKAVGVATALRILQNLGAVLGLCGQEPAVILAGIRDCKLLRNGLDRGLIETLVADRVAARVAKDFVRADVLRGELSGMGVVLMDGPEGTRWKIA